MTTRKPSNIDTKTIAQKIVGDWLVTNKTIRKIIKIKINALIVCWSLNTIGLPDIVPWSLPKAKIDPEKVIAPINVPTLISTKLLMPIAPYLPMPKAEGS